MHRSTILCVFIFCGEAAAAEVGFASSVDRNVTGELGTERRNLDRGSRVRTQELLVTDAEGRLSVQFVDRTLLSMGPRSRVRLDKFVMKADGSAREVTFNATRGAFRFATGISESRAYRINTPAGVMGVRGTRFAFDIEGPRLRVSVSVGSVQVCPPRAVAGACQIARPGRDVVVANRRASIAPAGMRIAIRAPLLLAPVTAAPIDLPRIAPLPRVEPPPLWGLGLPRPTDMPGSPHLGFPQAPRLPSLPGGRILGR